jgi:serine/threonine protein kinase
MTQPEGKTIGHYKILSPLGAGGMGEVYLAEDTRVGRKVALKLLPEYLTRDGERAKRFQQEARAVVALNHPNIVTVYEIGEANGMQFIASELVKGETVRARMSGAPMKLSEALEISVQVANALAEAHREGVIHRDIKPENIMIRPDGYVKVLDFGLAKLVEHDVSSTSTEAPTLVRVETNPGMVLGTAH